MGNVKKNNTPLSRFFLKYFMYLSIGILTIILFGLALFNYLIIKDMIYPANYAEKQANNAYDQIANAKTVDSGMIPDLCKYVLFDLNGMILSGNMEAKTVEKAWSVVQGNSSGDGRNYFKVIPRDSEYCVLKYNFQPQFKSVFLREHIPSPQLLLLLMIGFGFIIYTALIAIRFGKVLTQKLSPLVVATKKIENQELDFTISYVGIKEIDVVLGAMDQMRAALNDSLKKQWVLEQTRKEQLSALTHDLKTPLTVIRGNVDLINETELTEEQEENLVYIQSSILQMQDYIQALLDILRNEDSESLEIVDTDMETYVSKLKVEAEGLAVSKDIKIIWKIGEVPTKININQMLFTRAIMNIFSNAVDFTPQKGRIEYSIAKKNDMLEFKISDSGRGFTARDINKASEQFYMGDQSRTSHLHHGMGIYIADTIVKKHNGRLILGNSTDLGGAEVTIIIPY